MTNEEAIKRINNVIDFFFCTLTPEDKEALRFAISALERDRWISVEEALPEEKRAVLVWQPQYLNSYVVTLSEGEWYVFGGYGTKVFGVTHWRPLPEPPKEEHNGE